ncbi:MAG: gyrase subunit, partial [Actinomycetota bacterium]|nr:gyrase subunit [Actinomycetota bacterium]
LVKKTRLSEYDSNRTGGLIAVNLRDGDELVDVGVASESDDLLLVSVKGQSVRFTADDVTLRPMGRSTSGVTGMKFRPSDHLLSMSIVVNGSDPDVFVVFENGLAKRTLASEYTAKGRGILGVRVAQVSDRGGDLVGALTVDGEDEVMVVMEKGKIVRSRVDEVRRTGRNTMGVQFAMPDKRDSIVAVARNADRGIEVVLEGASGADVSDEEVATDDAEVATDDAAALTPTDSASPGETGAGSVTFEPNLDDNSGGNE